MPGPTAGTRNQRFWPANVDQDQAWGTNVKKLEDVTGSVVSTTINQHPNSAGTTTITAAPYTSRSTQGDDGTNLGWAINEASADGMRSGDDTGGGTDQTNYLRVIPAGTWRFLQRVNIPAPGLLGSLNLALTWKVYRVATGGGSRTLLFTHGPTAEQNGGALGGAVTYDETTASQSEIIMAVGETIHVAVLTTVRQVAGTLGGTAAGNMTIHTGGDADSFVEVPTPGIRAREYEFPTASNTPAGAMIKQPRQFHEGSVTPAATITRFLSMFWEGTITPAGTAFKQPKTQHEGSIGSTGAMLKQPWLFFEGTITPGPSLLRFLVQLLRTGTITPTAQRVIFVIKKFPTSSITPVGTLTKRYIQVPRTGSIAPGPGTLIRTPVKLLTATITPTSTIGALLRKVFLATITPTGNLTKGLFRFFTGSVTPTGSLIKQVRRFFTGLIGPTFDYPVTNPTKQVAGLVKDQSGNVVSGATVKLFRVADDAFIASTTSGAGGEYSFTRDQNDPYVYFVVAYEEVGTPTQGLTVRNLIPTVI